MSWLLPKPHLLLYSRSISSMGGFKSSAKTFPFLLSSRNFSETQSNLHFCRITSSMGCFRSSLKPSPFLHSSRNFSETRSNLQFCRITSSLGCPRWCLKPSPLLHSSRNLSETPPDLPEKSTSQAKLVDDEGFERVFMFTQILPAVLLNKLKIAQTAFVLGFLLPLYLYRYYTTETVTDAEISGVCSLSLLATTSLLFIGEYSRRIVGILYYHPEKKSVKVSHLSFFGNRLNYKIPLEDVIPISEISDTQQSGVFRLQQYDEKAKKMFIFIKFGTIYNADHFKTIFGEDPLK